VLPHQIKAHPAIRAEEATTKYGIMKDETSKDKG
jgi:hypothetical protein